jgi:hypothetical protein
MGSRDDVRSRLEARNQTTSSVEIIAGAREVDRAIAKLVLAFGTASEQARLRQARRNAPAMVMVSRFGFRRAFAAMMARSRRSLQKALLVKSKPMSAVPSR